MSLPNKQNGHSLNDINKTKSEHDPNSEQKQDQSLPSYYDQPTGALALQNGGKEDDPSFDLFSTRRPKGFGAGLSSGLKNVGKGLGAGLVTAIAAPIAGAKEGGLTGFGKGLGMGLIAAVALPIGGVATGVYQIGRGIINTPQQIQKSKENQEWDQTKREWYSYDLQKEAQHILNMSEEDFMKSQQIGNDEQKQNAKEVKDTAYYDLLNINTNASQPDIKRAYYKKARVLHPDKHPDEPEKYHKLFQELSTAYQVLSDPILRERYDRGGAQGMEALPVMDSSAFFQLMFGSEKFDFYVGELQLTQMMNNGMDAMQNMDESEEDPFQALFANSAALKFRQTKREVQCAVNLAATLQTFIDDPNAFKTKLENEAIELSSNVVGATLLKVVGYVYMEQSEKILGFKHSVGAGLGWTEMRRKGHEMANTFRVVKSAYNTYKEAKKFDKLEQENKENKGDNETNEMKENINDETKPMMGMIETLWNYSVIDIESTLRSVCHKLNKDSSVSDQVREERARGLYEMGRIFEAKGVDAEEGLRAFEEQVKEGIEMRGNIDKYMKEQEEQQKQ